MTAPVVYVNYGMQDDYRELAALGVSVEGKIAVARYGRGYRGIKAKLAEEHKAAALIIYSDPDDDGYVVGDPYPHGPWRPMSGIQRGSVLYTQIYPGDPLTPGGAATARPAGRVAPADAINLPRHSDDADQRAGRRRDSRKSRRPACPCGLAGRPAIHLSRRAGRAKCT